MGNFLTSAVYTVHMSKLFENISPDVISLYETWRQAQPLNPHFEQRLWQRLRIEWNYNSNHIEGNTLTYGETLLLLIHGRTKGEHLLREYDEMRGHDVAIEYVRDLVKQGRRLSEGDIRDLNRIVLKEGYWRSAQTADGMPTRKWIDPGAYKTQPNHVITATGELFHFSTPEETPLRMAEFVHWLGEELAQPTLNITMLLAQLHHRFIRIHPFDDGNGRVVRLLLNWAALSFAFPPLVIKSRERSRYIEAIQASDAGDFQPMAEFINANLRWTLELCNKAAHSLVPLEADVE